MKTVLIIISVLVIHSMVSMASKASMSTDTLTRVLTKLFSNGNKLYPKQFELPNSNVSGHLRAIDIETYEYIIQYQLPADQKPHNQLVYRFSLVLNANILQSFNAAYLWTFEPIAPNDFVSFLINHPNFLSVRNYCFMTSIVNEIESRYTVEGYTMAFKSIYLWNDVINMAKSNVILDLCHPNADKCKKLSYHIQCEIEFEDNQYSVADMKVSHYDYYSQLGQLGLIGDAIDVSNYPELNDAIYSHPFLIAILNRIAVELWIHSVYGSEPKQMFPKILSSCDAESFIESDVVSCKYNLIINRNSDRDKIWVTYDIKPIYDVTLKITSAHITYNSYHYTPHYKNQIDGEAMITADKLDACILDHPIIKTHISTLNPEEIVLLDPKPTFVVRAINKWNQLFANSTTRTNQ
jgi:hypothetical protein